MHLELLFTLCCCEMNISLLNNSYRAETSTSSYPWKFPAQMIMEVSSDLEVPTSYMTQHFSPGIELIFPRGERSYVR